tara:strand:- start:408 stop:2471 length:2064 start_codon:yes stop_codon:yes gene_type:complete
MSINKKINYLFNEVSSIKGVGKKISSYLKNKKIEKINDLLWNAPYSYTDRSNMVTLNKLEIGKILTIKIKVIKYNFPRIRNLPNKVSCEDSYGKIDIIFFNSREGYIRKVMPLNSWVVISGKINYYKNKYQITNPDYITATTNIDYVKKNIPKYSLTEGLNEKSYRKIIDEVLKNLPDIKEWYSDEFLKDMKFTDWKSSIIKIHTSKNDKDLNSNSYRRLAYDEIFSNLLVISENRKRLRKKKKKSKIFNKKASSAILKSLEFRLTSDQINTINEIENDLKSKNKMFRILQGDVGSGKTIVSLISIANTCEAGYQCALMAPTEILASQHYFLAKKIFKNLNIKIELLTSKMDNKRRKEIINLIENKKIDFLIGTHSLFQEKVKFKKLGLIIIDEQHKFGVRQRMKLAEKGGINCDVLLMSATPIPRTMILTIYGDMDVSKIKEKPNNRKKILTLSKPETKINELWPLIKKNIDNKDQIFWVCPLIEESKKLNYSSALKRFDLLKKKFPGKVGLIHGGLEKDEKDQVLKKFLKNEISILVSTTVIEVGIDFPNANLIIIENSNKFGLAQLHQLRGRVGRGTKQGMCILLYKGTLSQNGIKRIKILKSTNDGFVIAEEDMKLRGHGDIMGFKQSGIKFYKIADPVLHADLFNIAEKKIVEIQKLKSLNKYNFLLKLFDRAEIIDKELLN